MKIWTVYFRSYWSYKNAFIWTKYIIIGYHILIFLSHPISTRDTHISQRAEGPRTNMGISGWYGVWYENWHVITYLWYTSNFIKRHKKKRMLFWWNFLMLPTNKWQKYWCKTVIVVYIFLDIKLQFILKQIKSWRIQCPLKENFSQWNNCYNSIHCNFLFVNN